LTDRQYRPNYKKKTTRVKVTVSQLQHYNCRITITILQLPYYDYNRSSSYDNHYYTDYRIDLEGVEKVEGNSGEEVEQKPTADVVDGNQLELRDHLTAVAYIRRPKVEDYVCNGEPTGIQSNLL